MVHDDVFLCIDPINWLIVRIINMVITLVSLHLVMVIGHFGHFGLWVGLISMLMAINIVIFLDIGVVEGVAGDVGMFHHISIKYNVF